MRDRIDESRDVDIEVLQRDYVTMIDAQLRSLELRPPRIDAATLSSQCSPLPLPCSTNPRAIMPFPVVRPPRHLTNSPCPCR